MGSGTEGIEFRPINLPSPVEALPDPCLEVLGFPPKKVVKVPRLSAVIYARKLLIGDLAYRLTGILYPSVIFLILV